MTIKYQYIVPGTIIKVRARLMLTFYNKITN